jgi:regulatory protein
MSSSNLIDEDPYSEALTIALGAIGRRSLSKKQLTDYLLKRGTSLEVLNQTILRLEEMGYLNDLDFARNFTDRSRRKHSKRTIIQGLKERSIDQETIEWVIEDLSDEDEMQLALRFAAKKWRPGSADDEAMRRKVHASLMRRGFSSATISAVFKELSGSYGENSRL